MVEGFNLREIMTALRAQYFTLIEKGTVVLFVIDMNGRIQFASDNIENILFFKSEQLIGKNIVEVVELNSIPTLKNILKSKTKEPVSVHHKDLVCSIPLNPLRVV